MSSAARCYAVSFVKKKGLDFSKPPGVDLQRQPQSTKGQRILYSALGCKTYGGNMKESDIIIIKIKNWDKYQTRKDLKSMSFFRLQADVFYDEKMLELSTSEKLLFFCLLAETARKYNVDEHEMNTRLTRVNTKMIRRLTSLNTKMITRCLNHLEQLQLVSIETRDGSVPRQEKRREDKTRKEKIKVPESKKKQKPTKNSLVVKQDKSNELSLEFTQAKALRAQIWNAYYLGYEKKYGVPPLRNAKVNTQVLQLSKRLGREAVNVVEFFLSHPKQYYISKTHDLGLCLADAESLRTQYLKNAYVTEDKVKEFSKELRMAEKDREQTEWAIREDEKERKELEALRAVSRKNAK